MEEAIMFHTYLKDCLGQSDAMCSNSTSEVTIRMKEKKV